ncbi:DNA polymerase III subunit alpha [Oleiharenicola lentus]|uniref:DNA polymerase III subunit alpha n=1 Tax=Oleiharenicola lentus TaxID=2508720 RepID=UPI003F680247
MSGYVELHARSAFSFLRGASHPGDLAKAAHTLELSAIALLDRDGVSGAPELYDATRENRTRALVGAEITMEDGSVVPLLAASQRGYQNLCQLITEAKLTERPPLLQASEKEPALDPYERKRPCFATWRELADYSEGLVALTGDEEGSVRRAWRTAGKDSAATALQKLSHIFGRERLFVELQRQNLRGEEREIQFLRDLAEANGLPILATGGVNYAVPLAREVADIFTCLRLHTTLDGAGHELARNSERHLKSAREMRTLFRDVPEAVENSLRLADRLDFTLKDLGYEFPHFQTIAGEHDFLFQVTFSAARKRFRGTIPERVKRQLHTELRLIKDLGFSGYFLIIWDICRWAREEQGILVQGRGSAANSTMCYVLGITAVNPMQFDLLFERFLSKGRIGADGKPSWPDVDLDFPSGERREKVIQEIYRRYGRRGAAMTANIISYRGRSTVREVGKVLGFDNDALDRYSNLYANGDFPETLDVTEQLKMSGIAANHPRAATLFRLYGMIKGLPRHLGQHPGGMVICQGGLDKVVPLEQATMPDRSICQWDKVGCEDLGIVKIDFLGLGMMAVMQDTFELCTKRPIDPWPKDFLSVPQDDVKTYEVIRAADTVGVFQIESRAQMSTLPRFKPRHLYDLAMEVAMVRPGPIMGNAVHPIIRRREGLEAIDYIHPSVAHIVKPILERTSGIILFQEQMIELSMKLAGFSGADAEQLRRAMGFVHNNGRLIKPLARLKQSLADRKIPQAAIDLVMHSAQTFAAYGFPESHAISFALLAYSSTWLKVHRPAEFYASLLNNQPMGFYSASTLLQDGRRFATLKTNPVCVNHSDWNCTVEGERMIRLGLRYVKGVREKPAKQLIETRRQNGAFVSSDDFFRRTEFSATDRRALAAVGALNCFGLHRRSAMWQVEAAWSEQEDLFRKFAETDTEHSPLAAMTVTERFQADFSGTGVTAGRHPMALLRARLPDVVPAGKLKSIPNGERVTIAGSVICRQRPGTAKGVVFISLEDETGIANAVVYADFFEKHRLLITQETALRITGRVQNVANVVHVKTEHIEPLREADLPAQTSHDFH